VQKIKKNDKFTQFFFNFQIHLTITKLPRATNYTCVFLLDSGEWSTQADHWSFGLNCRHTPNVTSLGMDFGPKGILK